MQNDQICERFPLRQKSVHSRCHFFRHLFEEGQMALHPVSPPPTPPSSRPPHAHSWVVDEGDTDLGMERRGTWPGEKLTGALGTPLFITSGAFTTTQSCFLCAIRLATPRHSPGDCLRTDPPAVFQKQSEVAGGATPALARPPPRRQWWEGGCWWPRSAPPPVESCTAGDGGVAGREP